jgi:hypothetical protein
MDVFLPYVRSSVLAHIHSPLPAAGRKTDTPQSEQSMYTKPVSPPQRNSDRIKRDVLTNNVSIKPDPHIVAGNIARWFQTFNEIVFPVTIAADVLRLKKAFAQDGERVGKHMIQTATGVAAGLAGAYAGGSAGAQAAVSSARSPPA